MKATLTALDREWTALDRSPASTAALRRWATTQPALAGLDSLGAVLAARTHPKAAPAILSCLAQLAGEDALAARTLLQALLPGLVRMATTSADDDPAALDELVSLAWERIRSYPTRRPGSVAANVLLDVHKRYREHRAIEAPARVAGRSQPPETAPSAEEVAIGRSAVDDLVAAQRAGLISAIALRLILRTRLDDVSLEIAAAEQATSTTLATCIRWRAERRLRPLLAEAS